MGYISSIVSNGINQLPTLKFFAGSTVFYEYEFYHPDGSIIDLTIAGMAAIWQLCPFMHFDYPIIEKEMRINRSAKNISILQLSSSDTDGLCDEKYTQQIVLQWGNNRYRQSQGNILVLPRIANLY